MLGKFFGALLVGIVALLGVGPIGAAGRGDRLDRFRELAASRLALGQILEADAPDEAYREIYAVLDDEIVESLASGGPYASLAFLQDRLDSFADAWRERDHGRGDLNGGMAVFRPCKFPGLRGDYLDHPDALGTSKVLRSD